MRDKACYQTRRIRENIYLLIGARHSFFYTRNGSDASLLIDRAEVPLESYATPNVTRDEDSNSNEVQIGGLNTTDSRFINYKGYSGCVSSNDEFIHNLSL